jgi:hypothetical protein
MKIESLTGGAILFVACFLFYPSTAYVTSLQDRMAVTGNDKYGWVILHFTFFPFLFFFTFSIPSIMIQRPQCKPNNAYNL